MLHWLAAHALLAAPVKKAEPRPAPESAAPTEDAETSKANLFPDGAAEPDSEPEPDSDSAPDSEPESDSDPTPAPRGTFAPAQPPPSPKRATPRTAGDYDPDSGVPPGGYWEPGEAPEIAPEDGEEERLVAYILMPLAALTTASGAAGLWLTAPDHCPERLQQIGANATKGECKSLFIVQAIRTSYGLVGLVTGAVLLGIGLHRKKQYEQWKKSRFKGSIGLRPDGATLRIRF